MEAGPQRLTPTKLKRLASAVATSSLGRLRWVDRTPYDEARYLLALQKRQAPLLRFAAEHPS